MKKIISYLKSSRELPIFSIMLFPAIGFLYTIVAFPSEFQSISG